MNTAIETRQDTRPTASTMQDVIARGDLSKLTDAQRIEYYYAVCDSTGLNPLTRPFEFMQLQGKTILYAKKDCADQLRKINGINISLPSHSVNEAGLLTVHARAVDKTGRTDEDFGVVSIAGLKGEAAANAFLKCVTKAKRRVTLSISGLGLPDESEVEDMPAYATTVERPKPQARFNPQPKPAAPAEPQRPEGPPGKTGPYEIAREGDTADHWSVWATTLMGYIRLAPDVDTINEWTVRNADHLDKLKAYDATKFQRLIDMINHQLEVLNEAGS